MRFIKYNFLNGESFSFCLDYLISFESERNGTRVLLTSGRSEILPINIEDFSTKVFSDEHGHNEYQLIEIDEEREDEPRFSW